MTLAVVATAAIMAVIIGVAGAFDSDYRHQLKHQAGHAGNILLWAVRPLVAVTLFPFSAQQRYSPQHLVRR